MSESRMVRVKIAVTVETADDEGVVLDRRTSHVGLIQVGQTVIYSIDPLLKMSEAFVAGAVSDGILSVQPVPMTEPVPDGQ